MSDKKNKSLKPGWRQVKFGDVVQLLKARSQDPLADGIERYVGLEHLEPGDLRIRSWGNVADGVTFTSVFRPGQVLFGKRRAYQRKVAVADFTGVCSGDIYVLDTLDENVLLPELLSFICQTHAFFEHAVGTSAGSLSPRTNWKSLAGFEFGLPPIKEQGRITELLQAAAIVTEQVESARAKAECVYDAYLDHIHGIAIKGGKQCAVKDVCDVTVGIVVEPSKYYAQSGVLALRHSNVDKGEFLLDDVIWISQEGDRLHPKSSLREGDIVLPRVSTIAGRPYYAATVPSQLAGSNAIGVVIVRPEGTRVNSGFLEAFFNSPHMRRRLVGVAVGSIQRQLNVGILAKEGVSLLPLDAQCQIASVVKEIKESRVSLDSRLRLARQTQVQLLEKALGARNDHGL